ncbi:MAG: ATP-dependent zinc metalloprotease FtsH [Planctomycetota bacterium]
MSNQPEQNRPDQENLPRRGRNLPLMMLLLGLALIAFMMFSDQQGLSAPLTYAQFRRLGETGRLESVEILHNREGKVQIKGKLKNIEESDPKIDEIRKDFDDENWKKLLGKDRTYLVEDVLRGVIDDPNVESEIRAYVTPQNITFKESNQLLWTVLVSLLPWFLLLAFFYFIVFRPMRQAGGAGGVLSFGRSRARLYTPEMTNVTFGEVAGIEEAKSEVLEIIEFLRNPKKFQRLGGRIPRGVILIGAPGTGKTLLAKAIAGEAGVPFYAISGSDFVEMFVGVGASRVRDLFTQAKEKSPCLIFLDEIDAVGRRRGAGLGGGNDEREQTLNQILVEMDGFETDKGIIVIAATNRPDVLDPALLRPGRFDRQVTIDMPDVNGREAILTVHAKRVKLAPEVTLETIARGTPGFSGAELEAVINEGAIGAAMADRDSITLADLEEARDRIRFGRSRQSRVMTEEEKQALAYHEGGHALLNVLLPDTEPLHKVTIIPRGMSLGSTMYLPERDRYVFGMKHFMSEITMLYGGRIAEKMYTGDLSTGAANDIHRATDLARRMVTEFGMSDELGPLSYSDSEETLFLGREITRTIHHSDRTAHTIDDEIRRITSSCYEQAEKLLTENRDKLERLADALMVYESLTGEEARLAIDGGDVGRYREARTPPPKPPEPESQPADEKTTEGLPTLDRGPSPGFAGT